MNSAPHEAHAGGHSALHGAPGGLAVSAAGYTLQVSPKLPFYDAPPASIR